MARDGDGTWLSMSEIARRRGVTRAAICMQVNKLHAAGVLEVRRGNGHKCLVDVRAYEAATGLAVPAKAPARIDRRAPSLGSGWGAARITSLDQTHNF
jgi:hypothetical protein